MDIITKVVFVFLKRICAGSSVCVAQTTCRHCHLQTVCFFQRRFIKKMFARALLGADLAQPLLRSSKVWRGLNTTTHHHRLPPPSTTTTHRLRPPPTTVHHHHRRTPPLVYLRSLHMLKKQTFFLQTVEV
ncbi:hypothetical protein HanPI659440_Chr06g0240121 [Helianthus annuus]|nr:hypothetical protein HanPI659440_Chr06g0240121 [Helianthus annuus]